jgi:RHS repeat-associated protein
VAELNGRNVGYGYDNDYRLSSEAITGDPAGNNGTVSYTQYDAVGNRLQMTSTLNAVPGGSFFYDANDRLTTDQYDNNGNTTSSAGILNRYDFENRMITHGAVTIVYDGDGNRVSETVGGTTTKYLVDDHNPTGLPQVLDEIVSGSVTRTYAYGLQRISENQLVGSTWTPSFYGYDGHGNVRFLSNTAVAVTDTYQYDAFGMPIASSGTTANNYLYSGEQYDSNAGWYQLRQRWYGQAVGRFTTRDPVEGTVCSPLSFNPYIYANDDPVNHLDPSGQQAIAEYLILLAHVPSRADRHYGAGLCVAFPAIQLRNFGGCVYLCEVITEDPLVSGENIIVGVAYFKGAEVTRACGPGRYCPIFVVIEVPDARIGLSKANILSCVQ